MKLLKIDEAKIEVSKSNLELNDVNYRLKAKQGELYSVAMKAVSGEDNIMLVDDLICGHKMISLINDIAVLREIKRNLELLEAE